MQDIFCIARYENVDWLAVWTTEDKLYFKF